MQSNFDFLKQQFSDLYEASLNAERSVYTAPRTACMHARRALELTVRDIYKYDKTLNTPYEETLSAMMHEPEFKENLDMGLFPRINLIRKLGNLAIHSDSEITKYEALKVLRNLYDFQNWFAICYSTEGFVETEFDENIIPKEGQSDKRATELQQIIERLEEKDEQKELAQKKLLEVNEQLRMQLEQYMAQIQAQKPDVEKQAQKYAIDPNEAETREMYIDLMLREAGWNPKEENVEEYEVSGMPNSKGKGWVDYVLWGNDGKPLGLVEAKRTKASPKKGQHQAKLYADCLEKEFGQRPIIFYSNGFETWIWDDTRYPARPVNGFYTKGQLERLINRRDYIESIKSPKVNKAIAGGNDRNYQIEAIQRVCEHLEKGHRKSLLVMATGTGKTRVSAALVDVLTKANWVKRVLFLADRNALVTQAKNAYGEYLPNLSSVDLTQEKEDDKSRIVFSTYQTMMNMINEANKDRTKRFAIGYFDLIIIDEAHRSVYQKYQEIFNYFDAMLLGLTATPKDEVDKNTYELFDLESGVPTFAYDLNEAVDQGFLVPPKAIEVPSKFQREGIKYAELSEDEKDEYEASFLDEESGELPDEIRSSALNKWLFNADTVDKVIDYLMDKGVKVESGNKLGKTIIFATNQKHADYIEERFDIKYPQFKGDFLQVITHGKKYAHDLIDKFKSKESKNPFIAVSVDMLDTGIDVPDIVNLVFFKKVRSKAKFWQMIGRGTRLREDLFGPGDDKEFFLVFDFYGNFEFFDEYPDGFKSATQESVNQKIFKAKVRLIKHIQDSEYIEDEKYTDYRKRLIDNLYVQLGKLDQENFIVRPHLKYLHKYLENKNIWMNLSDSDVVDINDHLSGLPVHGEEDELAVRFDLLMLQLQETFFKSSKRIDQLQKQVIANAEGLQKKMNIPDVAKEKETILEVQSTDFWADTDIHTIEKVRLKLRDLIKFIDKKNAYKNTYTDIEDQIGEGKLRENIGVEYKSASYKKKIQKYIQENLNHSQIKKLQYELQMNQKDIDELVKLIFKDEPDSDISEEFENPKDLAKFIRSLVGLDRTIVQKKFSRFLDQTKYTADQITFVKMIIDNIVRNGILRREDLYDNPFTYAHDYGVEGVFEESDTNAILDLVSEFSEVQYIQS